MLLLMTHHHCHGQKSGPTIIVNGLHLLYVAPTHARTHRPIHTEMAEKLPCKAGTAHQEQFEVSLSDANMLSGGVLSMNHCCPSHTSSRPTHETNSMAAECKNVHYIGRQRFHAFLYQALWVTFFMETCSAASGWTVCS